MRGLIRIRRAAVAMAAAAGAGTLVAGMVTAATRAAAAEKATVAGVEAALPANAGSDPGTALSSLSCAAAGSCTATGHYLDRSGHTQGLLLTQTAGAWATGVKAPLPANAGSNPGAILDSVSCAAVGNCTAVGTYTDSSGHTQGLLLTQTS